MSDYTINLYTTNSKPTNNDQRLSVISWKTPKDAPAGYVKPPTLCVSVPRVQLTVEPVVLRAPLENAFQNMQDEIIRDFITQLAATQRVGSTISSLQISATAVAAYQATTSSRLNGEQIETWFDTKLADQLTVALANKLGVPDDATPEQLAKITLAVSDQRLRFRKLAGPQTKYPSAVATGLLRTLNLLGESRDELAVKLTDRLTTMLAETPTELLVTL